MSRGYPEVSSSRYGRKVDQEATVKAVAEALPLDGRRVQIVAQSTKPDITDGDIGSIVVIKQSEFKLYLYNGETLEDTFKVAVGTPQYPTPNGKFYILEKEEGPVVVPAQVRLGERQEARYHPARETRSGRTGWTSGTASAYTRPPTRPRSATPLPTGA